MLLEITGRVVYWDGEVEPITAAITPRVEQGCRVYVAHLPGTRLVRALYVDAMPVHTTVELHACTCALEHDAGDE